MLGSEFKLWGAWNCGEFGIVGGEWSCGVPPLPQKPPQSTTKLPQYISSLPPWFPTRGVQNLGSSRFGEFAIWGVSVVRPSSPPPSTLALSRAFSFFNFWWRERCSCSPPSLLLLPRVWDGGSKCDTLGILRVGARRSWGGG